MKIFTCILLFSFLAVGLADEDVNAYWLFPSGCIDVKIPPGRNKKPSASDVKTAIMVNSELPSGINPSVLKLKNLTNLSVTVEINTRFAGKNYNGSRAICFNPN